MILKPRRKYCKNHTARRW